MIPILDFGAQAEFVRTEYLGERILRLELAQAAHNISTTSLHSSEAKHYRGTD